MQIVKSSMPLVVCGFEALLALERPPRAKLQIALMVSVGIAMASLGEFSFDIVGFSQQTGQVITDSARLVLMQRLVSKPSQTKQGLELDPVSALFHVAPSSAILCATISFVLEKDVATSSPPALLIFLNSLCAFALNLSIVVAIQCTSSLFYTLIGSLKATLIVILGGLSFHTPMSGLQAGGYLISSLGLVFYTEMRLPGREGLFEKGLLTGVALSCGEARKGALNSYSEEIVQRSSAARLLTRFGLWIRAGVALLGVLGSYVLLAGYAPSSPGLGAMAANNNDTFAPSAQPAGLPTSAQPIGLPTGTPSLSFDREVTGHFIWWGNLSLSGAEQFIIWGVYSEFSPRCWPLSSDYMVTVCVTSHPDTMETTRWQFRRHDTSRDFLNYTNGLQTLKGGEYVNLGPAFSDLFGGEPFNFTGSWNGRRGSEHGFIASDCVYLMSHSALHSWDVLVRLLAHDQPLSIGMFDPCGLV